MRYFDMKTKIGSNFSGKRVKISEESIHMRWFPTFHKFTFSANLSICARAFCWMCGMSELSNRSESFGACKNFIWNQLIRTPMPSMTQMAEFSHENFFWIIKKNNKGMRKRHRKSWKLKRRNSCTVQSSRTFVWKLQYEREREIKFLMTSSFIWAFGKKFQIPSTSQASRLSLFQ